MGTDRDRQDHEQEHEDRLEKLGPAFGEEHHRHHDEGNAEGACLGRGMHAEEDVAKPDHADSRHEAEEAAEHEKDRGEDLEDHQSWLSSSVPLVRSM